MIFSILSVAMVAASAALGALTMRAWRKGMMFMAGLCLVFMFGSLAVAVEAGRRAVFGP